MSHWASGLSQFEGLSITGIDESDIGGSYEFDSVAIVKDQNGAYYVVSSSGCSCPTHEEKAMYDAGPFNTYAEALGNVPDTHRHNFKCEE